MIRLKDVYSGEIILAATAHEVATYLRDSARFCAHETIEEYMKGFAAREKIFSGKDIRFDNTDVFVEDIIKNGLMSAV
jgi:hypothetical protein